MNSIRNLFSACLSAALLAACGGSYSGLSSSTASSFKGAAAAQHASGRTKNAVTETVLHTFTGGSDGAVPASAELTELNGTLYGITRDGGGTGCGGNGCGTIFKLSPSGTEKVLYDFKGGSADGVHPKGGLVERSGVLYGTTQGGGPYGAGTFFKITTAGKKTGLYDFGAPIGSGYDGIYPYGRLIYVQANDMFYGTTIAGGSGSCSGGCGIAFSVTPSGKETILHSFKGGKDGDFLTGNLLYEGGKLYGTTQLGGGGGGSACTSSGVPAGCGTVFSVSTSGKEKVLYRFTAGADGAFPDAGVIDLNGTLYGMAGQGGGTGCGGRGCGSIFGLSTSGSFRTVYSFQGPPSDGAGPFGNLTKVNGSLYGATEYGGAGTGSPCPGVSGIAGCGVVFHVTTSGHENVLYSFKGSPDGAVGNTTLLYINGLFYGTTDNGGSVCEGSGVSCGTVFSITR